MSIRNLAPWRFLPEDPHQLDRSITVNANDTYSFGSATSGLKNLFMSRSANNSGIFWGTASGNPYIQIQPGIFNLDYLIVQSGSVLSFISNSLSNSRIENVIPALSTATFQVVGGFPFGTTRFQVGGDGAIVANIAGTSFRVVGTLDAAIFQFEDASGDMGRFYMLLDEFVMDTKHGNGTVNGRNLIVRGGTLKLQPAGTVRIQASVLFETGAYDIGQGAAGNNPRFVSAGTSLLGPDGSASIPAFGFYTGSAMGMYRIAANTIGWSTSSGLKMQLDHNLVANETSLSLHEGVTPTQRRVKWMDPGAGGANFVGGERVMILV